MSDLSQLSDDELLALASQHVQPSVMDNYDPSSGTIHRPTEGMSTGELVAAGAGKAVSDLGTGIEQLAASAGNKLGLVSDKTVADIQGQIDETKARDQALMRETPAQLGYAGSEIATTLLPVGAASVVARAAQLPRTAEVLKAAVNPRTYKAAATTGGALGAIQPVASDDWGGGAPFLPPRALNALTGMAGGALGNLGASALGRVGQPLAVAGPEDRDAASILQAAGVPLDLSQRSGSTFLRRVRSALGDNPVTAGAQHEADLVRQQAFNDAVLQTIGVEPGAKAATRDVLGPARDRISGVFEDVLSRNAVPVDQPFINSLGSIQSQALMLEKKAPSNVVNHVFDVLLKKGELDGQTAYAIKKNIDGLLSSSDSTERDLGSQLHEVLMNQMHGAMSAEDQAALSQARRQFRNMKTIEPAISTDGLGNISPARLANQVGAKRNRAASLYGRGSDSFMDLVDLAQSGKQLLPDNLANSGTHARQSMDLIPLAKGLVLGKPAQAVLNFQSPYWAQGLPTEGVGGLARWLTELPNQSDLAGGALRRLPVNLPLGTMLSSPLSEPAAP